MNCVLICAVLSIIGNVGSFVLNRTKRDTSLDQTIRELYGPPILSNVTDQTSHLTNQTETKLNVTEKEPPIQDAERDAIRNIWAEITEPADPKSDGKNAVPADIQAEINRLFPPSTYTTPPLEFLTATENYTETNYTGPAFDSDDRFLPLSFIKTAHENSVEEEKPKVAPELRSLSPKRIEHNTESNFSNEDNLKHQPNPRTVIINQHFNSEANQDSSQHLNIPSKSNVNNESHSKEEVHSKKLMQNHASSLNSVSGLLVSLCISILLTSVLL